MIQPTIGRVLWYHPAHGHPEAPPHAAIVAFVWDDNGAVNLACFDQHGMSYSATRVPLFQGEGNRPDKPYAEWMPYQLGQAAKATEKTEDQAAAFT